MSNLLTLIRTNSVRIVKGTLRFTRRNSNWILAWLAVLGITGLTWATIKGTIKAVKLCEEKQVQGRKEMIRTVWRVYIPAAGFFILTTVSILSNAKINASKLALMTGLYAMKEADLNEFRNKVKQMVGPKKEQAIETEVEKDKIKRLPPPEEKDIVKTGHGDQLFREWLTGQWFRASPDYIDLIQEKINNSLKDQVDNIVMRGYMHDFLHLRKCGADELFWDLAEMKQNGYDGVTLDCTHTDWEEVNGKQEMVCTLRCYPEATGF